MDFEQAKTIAEKNLTDGATLSEMKEVVRDLRALSPDSELANRIEAKIRQILASKLMQESRRDD
jgi:hypothetical protein